VTKKLKTIQDYFDFFTKDFETDPAPKQIWIKEGEGIKSLKEYRIELPSELSIRHPYMVFVIFVYIKKFRFTGKWEKVAWEIPIKYKGTPFILTHRKFGFRIISNYKNESIKKKAIDAITNIHKAMRYAEELIEPFVKTLIRKGNITLDNEFSIAHRRYDFFRGKAIKEFKTVDKSESKFKINLKDGYAKAIKSYNKSLQIAEAGRYYITAMLDSYFSLLEHTFVLLLPFLTNVNVSLIDLEKFIGLNWKEKFKIVLPPNSDTEAMQLLERLDKIKEQLRNPLTHGYFLKNGNSFYVHIPNLHAIPMTLTKSKEHFKYSFEGPTAFNYKEILKCFDDFDKYLLKNNKTKFGMMYIKSSLSIAFDQNSCDLYRAEMSSVLRFKRFIKSMNQQHDTATNMDW
jgi:hypothetical protein